MAETLCKYPHKKDKYKNSPRILDPCMIAHANTWDDGFGQNNFVKQWSNMCCSFGEIQIDISYCIE